MKLTFNELCESYWHVIVVNALPYILFKFKKQKLESKFTQCHTVFLLKKQSVTDFLPSGRTITPLCDKREQCGAIVMNNRIAYS